ALTGIPPVLCLPQVFEPEFCRTLVHLYEQQGGHETGIMRDQDGKTFGVADYRFKRRSDHDITDPNLIAAAQERLVRRLFPEVRKAFQFNATHIERYIVACYDSGPGGYFKPHRDNVALV